MTNDFAGYQSQANREEEYNLNWSILDTLENLLKEAHNDYLSTGGRIAENLENDEESIRGNDLARLQAKEERFLQTVNSYSLFILARSVLKKGNQ